MQMELTKARMLLMQSMGGNTPYNQLIEEVVLMFRASYLEAMASSTPTPTHS